MGGNPVMDPASITGILMYGGALTACLLFIGGLVRRWWRMENSHTELMLEKDKRIAEMEARAIRGEKERDDWRDIALTNANLGEQAMNVAQRMKR